MSLLSNIIIFSIFTQFSPLLWISSFPAVSQIGSFVYENSPEKAQGFLLWITLKIKTFLFWIWSGLLDYIKWIIKAVIGEIEKDPIPGVDPIINPDKGKYEDIYNPEYRKRVNEFLYDWKYYIIGGFFLLELVL